MISWTRVLTATSFFLFLAGIVAFLAQLWFALFSEVLFVKLMITDGAFFLIALVLNFILREHAQTKKINEGSRLE